MSTILFPRPFLRNLDPVVLGCGSFLVTVALAVIRLMGSWWVGLYGVACGQALRAYVDGMVRGCFDAWRPAASRFQLPAADDGSR